MTSGIYAVVLSSEICSTTPTGHGFTSKRTSPVCKGPDRTPTPRFNFCSTTPRNSRVLPPSRTVPINDPVERLNLNVRNWGEQDALAETLTQAVAETIGAVKSSATIVTPTMRAAPSCSIPCIVDGTTYREPSPLRLATLNPAEYRLAGGR